MRLVQSLLLAVLISSSNSANVLFFFGISTYSHRIAVWPLVEKLIELGHGVTFHQPFHPKFPHPKVREFFPKSLEAKLSATGHFTPNLITARIQGGRLGSQLPVDLPELGVHHCRLLLNTTEVKELIENEHFDIVVLDSIFNECGYGFAEAFDAKVIVYGTTSVMAWWADAFGFPVEGSWIPELHIAFPFPLGFSERLMSTLIPLVIYYYRTWFYYPQLNQLFSDYFQVKQFDISAIEQRRTALFLVNTHFSEEFARSLPPLVVPGKIFKYFCKVNH